MALFWQTVVFLLLAAALGFVIGWVTRGARASGERAAAAAPPQAGMDAALVEECDRLRAELAAVHDSERQLEDSLVQLRGLADARASRVHELERAETSSRERNRPADYSGPPLQARCAQNCAQSASGLLRVAYG